MNAAAEAALRRQRLVALLVAGTFFMEFLDGTAIAPALPAMARDFGARSVDLNIGMGAYLLTLGIFIPASGWVAERFGARSVFSWAIVLFTGASALCGLTDTVAGFVAARVLQGVGGAMMVPVGRLIVLGETPKERLLATIATLTWPALAAPVIGPAIGGFITEHASWRWIFYLNLPLGLIALAVALRIVPRLHPRPVAPLDWTGFVLSAAGIAGITGGVEAIGATVFDWPEVATLGGGGALLLALAVRHFRRVAHPLLDLAPLAIRSYAANFWGGSLYRFAVGAVPFLLPLMYQSAYGYDATRAGLMLILVFAGNLAMKPATTTLLRRFGLRRILIASGLGNALTLALVALLNGNTPIVAAGTLLVAAGMARSMQFTALNVIAFAEIPKAQMAMANTLYSTIMQLTMGMGIAVGALALKLGEAAAGPGPASFHIAFLVLAALPLLGLVDAVRLPKDIGGLVTAGATR